MKEFKNSFRSIVRFSKYVVAFDLAFVIFFTVSAFRSSNLNQVFLNVGFASLQTFFLVLELGRIQRNTVKAAVLDNLNSLEEAIWSAIKLKDWGTAEILESQMANALKDAERSLSI